ncbi:MAG: alpha/beta hydrolase [Steroidobacteraceae bacterium]
MSKLVVAVGIVAVIAALYGIAVWFAQPKLMFPLAGKGASPHPIDGAERVVVTIRAGRVEHLVLKPGGDGAHPLVIFAHGNAETAGDWVNVLEPLRAAGIAVLILEYPGYAGSAGRPSQLSLVEAARAALAWAMSDARIDATRMVLWGRSLGGGVAAQLAADSPVAGLILESSFTSVRPLAAAMGVPSFLVRDPFDSVAALRNYHGPLLVLHGERDAIIPIAHGRALAAAVPGSAFVAMPCGHNDCARPWVAVHEFLERVGAGRRRPEQDTR